MRGPSAIQVILRDFLPVRPWNTPHPTLLRRATFSRKGRRDAYGHPLDTLTYRLGAKAGMGGGVGQTDRNPPYAGRKIGSFQSSWMGLNATWTFMPMVTSSGSMSNRLETSRAPGAPSRSTTTGM